MYSANIPCLALPCHTIPYVLAVFCHSSTPFLYPADRPCLALPCPSIPFVLAALCPPMSLFAVYHTLFILPCMFMSFFVPYCPIIPSLCIRTTSSLFFMYPASYSVSLSPFFTAIFCIPFRLLIHPFCPCFIFFITCLLCPYFSQFIFVPCVAVSLFPLFPLLALVISD